EKKFDRFAIAETAHEVRSSAIEPRPTGGEMQHRLVGPPRLVIVIDILGKSARVHQPEVRADARPAIRRGFAAVIKSRPHEPAAREWMRRVIRPPRPRFLHAVFAIG